MLKLKNVKTQLILVLILVFSCAFTCQKKYPVAPKEDSVESSTDTSNETSSTDYSPATDEGVQSETGAPTDSSEVDASSTPKSDN